MTYTRTATVVLLDTKTGEPAGELNQPLPRSAVVLALSSDGRLLLAHLSSETGGRLVAWDTKTAREVKGWALPARDQLAATFTPGGYELAIAQTEETPVYDPASKGSVITRTDFTTTVGIWNLSPVVK